MLATRISVAAEDGMAVGAWWRPQRGFEWRDGLRVVGARSKLRSDAGPWLVACPGERTQYPVLDRPRVLLAAAEQLGDNPTEEAVMGFAVKHGPMGIAVSLADISGDGWNCEGESLRQWQEEFILFAGLRRLWSLAATRRTQDIERYLLWTAAPSQLEIRLPERGPDGQAAGPVLRRKTFLVPGRALPNSARQRRDELVIHVTRSFVCDAVNEKLRGHMSPVVLGNGARIRFAPHGLLSAIYWAFARELVGGQAEERECPNPSCPNGRVFIPTRGNQMSCDGNCRKLASYYRKQLGSGSVRQPRTTAKAT